jgi:hypothetical protein
MNFIIGIVAGGLGWYISWIVSGKFEPFDSDLGFYTSQLLLSFVSFVLGYKTDSWVKMLQIVLGIYVGQVFYVYIFGGSEGRAWIFLGMVTIVALCIYPLIAGIAGVLVKKVKHKKLGVK